MGTWTTPNNRSSISFGGFTFNIGDARNAGYNPFQPQNIPFGVLRGLARMNQMKNPFGSGNPLAIGTPGEDTYIDNSFAQQTDANVATCEAQGKDFDPVNQICVPKNAGGASVGGAGYTLPQAIEDLAGTDLPGVLDIPVIGDAVNSGLDGIAGVIDVISEGIGLGDGWKKEVILGGDGVVINVLDANQPSQNTGGGAVSAQSGNTTVGVDTGSPAGNIILAGGTLGGLAGEGLGEGTDTELLMRGLCAMQGKEYDENTGLCKQAPSSQPPGGSTAGGTTTTGGGGTDGKGGDTSTTVTIGGATATDPCDDPVYAADNPLECLKVIGPNTGGVGPIQQKICPDGTLVGMDDACPATQVTGGTSTKRTKQKICPDGSSVEENEDCPDTTTTTTKTCPDGSVIDINEDCPATTKICDDGSVVDINEDCPDTTKTCPDGSVIDINEDCPATTKTCPDGSVIDINEDCPGTTALTKTCWDNSVVAIDAKCPDKPLGPDPIPVCGDNTKLAGKPIPADGNCDPVGSTQTQPDCTDPVYAVENPVECGGGISIDPCTELQGECAKLGQCADCDTMQCEECPPAVGEGGVEGEEIIPSLCGDEVYAMLNPEICNPSPQYSMPSGGISRLSSKKSGVADLGVDYDIGGRSIFAPPQAASGGKIENYDLITYLDDILRGR